jgi:methyl-accepting chemotaxis protein
MMETQALQKVVNQVQKLSHTNSNNRCSKLTLTKTVELADLCDGALERLLQLLAAQVDADRVSIEAGYHRSLAITGGAALLGILIGLFLGRQIALSITQPVAQGVELAHALAQGDLTRRLKLTQNDEIGHLTRAIDQAAENFASIVAEIHGVSDQIGASSAELGAVSHQLLSQSEEMSTQAGFVAGSTEQMTVNINTMAAAAEQMSMNVASISSASEEISVNVGTISGAAGETSTNVGSVVDSIQLATRSFKAVSDDASEGAQISAKAAGLAVTATQTMTALDRSAGEISKVTEMIKLIAMQTNLLALNATIEATSAGDAGKGFAVVANEIKQLANQSGKAAEDIARMIEGIQGNTRSAVSVIEEVAETISAINTASDRIFRAIDTQTKIATESGEKLHAAGQGVEHIALSINEVSKGTNDMSRNASEAAKAATDVSHNASEAARAVREVSSNIRGVSEATRLNTTSAQQVNQAAARLQEISTNLERIVRHFRITRG